MLSLNSLILMMRVCAAYCNPMQRLGMNTDCETIKKKSGVYQKSTTTEI